MINEAEEMTPEEWKFFFESRKHTTDKINENLKNKKFKKWYGIEIPDLNKIQDDEIITVYGNILLLREYFENKKSKLEMEIRDYEGDIELTNDVLIRLNERIMSFSRKTK